MANRVYMKSSDMRRSFRDVLEHVIRGDEVVVEHYSRPVALISPYPQKEDIMTYTFEIEISSDGDIWQAVAPAETFTAQEVASLGIESAQDALDHLVANQTAVAADTLDEGSLWRIRVWQGNDTGAEPDAQYRGEGADIAG